MKTKLALLSIAALPIISACAPANVSSNLRPPSSDNLAMMTRCVDFSTGTSEVNKQLSQYDGWKVVYASEYTTGNKSTTSMVMCFEKPTR
jgi:hypothetical protein